MFTFLDEYPFLLPFIIFFGRIADVSLGTLRIIFVSKGERYKAPIVGFFEVLIWIVVISQIFSRANSMLSYVSYAAGYATGNYVGIMIERRIAFGIILLRMYTKKNGKELVSLLSEEGYGATTFKGSGSKDAIDIVETVVDRKSMKNVVRVISEYDADVFYVSEDVRTRERGIFPKTPSLIDRWRQGK